MSCVSGWRPTRAIMKGEMSPRLAAISAQSRLKVGFDAR